MGEHFSSIIKSLRLFNLIHMELATAILCGSIITCPNKNYLSLKICHD